METINLEKIKEYADKNYTKDYQPNKKGDHFSFLTGKFTCGVCGIKYRFFHFFHKK